MAQRLPTAPAAGQPLSAGASLATGVSAGLPMALLVFAVTIATFLPALDGAFLAWDDDVNFTLNPHFQGLSAEHLHWMFTSFHVGHYMPLTWLSAALDFELFGLDPRAFHRTSVILHASGALFLCLALRQLLELLRCGRSNARLFAPAAGALFFALHPLRVESVAWATERRDVLAGALLLASVWAWLRMQSPGARRRPWYVASVLLFALSLLSKVSGMTLPLALLLVDAWLLGRRAWLEKLPYFALGAAGAVLGFLGQRESTEVLASLDQLPLLERFLQAGFALVFYLQKTLLPTGLSPFYEQRTGLSPLPLAAVVLGSLALLLSARRGSVWARTGWCTWACYVALALPLIGLVKAGNQLAADRYTYIACLPFAALFGAGACLALSSPSRVLRGGTGLLVAAVLVGLGDRARNQTAVWHDTESLFRRVLEVEPDNYLGHRKLGIALHEQERYDEAIEHYQACLQVRARGSAAGRDDAWSSLAITYLARGGPDDFAAAVAALEAALAENPRQRLAWSMYEDLNLQAGRVEPLIARMQNTLTQHPDFASGHIALARLLSRVGRDEEAIEALHRATDLTPEDATAHNLWGLAEASLGRYDRAVPHLRRAVELRPDEAAYRTNLEFALAQ